MSVFDTETISFRVTAQKTGDRVRVEVPKSWTASDIVNKACDSLKLKGESQLLTEDGTHIEPSTPANEISEQILVVTGEATEDESKLLLDALRARDGQNLPHRQTQTWVGVERTIASCKDQQANDVDEDFSRTRSWSGPVDEGLPPRRDVKTCIDNLVDFDEELFGEAKGFDDEIENERKPRNSSIVSDPTSSVPTFPSDSSKVWGQHGQMLDTNGDGFFDSYWKDTTGDGQGNVIVPLRSPAEPVPMSQINTDSIRAVYVDRIPPDASDSMIIAAITKGLPPYGKEKVVSLEVIRNQKTRHCHAFAFLNYPPPDSMLELHLGKDEYIRVQASDKERAVPTQVKPRSTLHVRLYTRREGWAANVSKMTWAGLLAILEMVSPGERITDCIRIIADDRSKKNAQVHRSVVLCAFFVECKSIPDADRLRRAVHDRRTDPIDDVIFLVQCDYTLNDKHLHDTCKRKEGIQRQFNGALATARSLVGDGSVRHFVSKLKELFEFDDPTAETRPMRKEPEAKASVPSLPSFPTPTLQPNPAAGLSMNLLGQIPPQELAQYLTMHPEILLNAQMILQSYQLQMGATQWGKLGQGAASGQMGFGS